MLRWHGRSSREVNSLREIPVLKRVVERHTLGARRREDLGEPRRERLIRKLVGPETEDAAGMEMAANSPSACARLRSLVAALACSGDWNMVVNRPGTCERLKKVSAAT